MATTPSQQHPPRCGYPPPPEQTGDKAARPGTAQARIATAPAQACPASSARRVAPDTRPDRIAGSTFPLVRAIPGNGLRNRKRSFESCLVVTPEAGSHHEAG